MHILYHLLYASADHVQPVRGCQSLENSCRLQSLCGVSHCHLVIHQNVHCLLMVPGIYCMIIQQCTGGSNFRAGYARPNLSSPVCSCCPPSFTSDSLGRCLHCCVVGNRNVRESASHGPVFNQRHKFVRSDSCFHCGSGRVRYSVVPVGGAGHLVRPYGVFTLRNVAVFVDQRLFRSESTFRRTSSLNLSLRYSMCTA